MAKRHNRKKSSNHGDKSSSQQGPSRPKGDPKFSMTVKWMYKFIQAEHHLIVMRNQKEGALVKAFRHKSDELGRFLKPASPDGDVEKALLEVNQSWISGATEALINHYEKVKGVFSIQLEEHELKDNDFDKAKDIALSWAKKNLGKKLSKTTFETFDALCNSVKSKRTAKNQQAQSKSVSESSAESTRSLDTPTRKRARSPAVTPNSQTSPPSKQRNALESSPAAQVEVPAGRPAAQYAEVLEAPSGTPKRKHVSSPAASPNSQASPPAKQRNTQAKPSEVQAESRAGPPQSPRGAQAEPRRTQPAASRGPRVSFKPYRAQSGARGANWQLPILKAKTLIIGDSNLSIISESPVPTTQIEVCSYPGAKFYNLRGLLRSSKPQEHVKNLILSVGINERGNNIKKTCVPQLNRLLSEVKQVFPNAKIFMAGLQWKENKLKKFECENLELLQNEYQQCKDFQVLPQLDQSDFEIDPEDNYNIHWSEQTANKMLDIWIDHLN